MLPWSFPPKQRLNSDSYTFGFNNLVAELGLALGLALLLGVRLSDSRAVSSDLSLNGAIGNPSSAPSISRWWALMLFALVVLVVGGWWSFLPYAYFGEASYFLPKLDLMVLGKIPYRDFEFGYGPLMLYGPYWLYRLSGGLIAIDSAYVVNLLGHFGFSILAIESIMKNFAISSRWRIYTLAFAVLATTNITMGILYTPLRFVFPLWAVFFLHWKLAKAGPARLFWTLLILSAGFGISPECGTVTWLATLTSILWRSREQQFQIVPPLLAVGASLLVTWLLFGPAYFALIRSFGGGAFNFPILPTPYMICLVVVAGAFLPRIAVNALHGKDSFPALWASVLIATGMFLPAALGRCDPGHVLVNALGLLLVGVGLGANSASSFTKLLAPVAALVIGLTSQISFWNRYEWQVSKAIAVKSIIDRNESSLWKMDNEVFAVIRKEPGFRDLRWDKRLPFEADTLELLRFPEVAAPVGCPEEIDRFLKLTGRNFPEYWVPANSGVFTEASVGQRAAILSKAKFLIVPKDDLSYFEPKDRGQYAKEASALFTSLFVFPTHVQAVHDPFSTEAEVVKATVPGYAVAATFRDYLILSRDSSPRGDATSDSSSPVQTAPVPQQPSGSPD